MKQIMQNLKIRWFCQWKEQIKTNLHLPEYIFNLLINFKQYFLLFIGNTLISVFGMRLKLVGFSLVKGKMPVFDETMFENNYQFISPKQDKPIPDLVWDLWIIPASPSCTTWLLYRSCQLLAKTVNIFSQLDILNNYICTKIISESNI